MTAILRAELADLLRNPLTWIATVAVVVACFYFGTHSPHADNGYVIYAAALSAGALTAGFFVLAAAAVSVATERTRGTVRWILPRPIGRAGFVAGKGLATALFALWLVAVCIGVSGAVASGAGFQDVVLETGETESPFEFEGDAAIDPEFQAPLMRRRMLAATLRILPALLTIAGLGLLVSCLFRNAAGAVIGAIALLLPLHFLPEVLGLSAEAARLLPIRVAQESLEQLSLFGRSISDAQWPEYGPRAALGAFLGIFALPLMGAAYFSRIDITD